MTRSKHHLTLTIPLPSSISASSLISHIHTHAPLFRAQAYVTNFDPILSDLPSILSDPFFLAAGLKIRSFEITEQVPLLPGVWNKQVRFPAVCQNLEDGARVRADAPAGVRVWSEYRIVGRKRIHHHHHHNAAGGGAGGEGEGGEGGEKIPRAGDVGGGVEKVPLDAENTILQQEQGGDEWQEEEENGGRGLEKVAYDLNMTVSVECNSMLMPFVSRSMEGAHRELGQKVIDEVIDEQRGVIPPR